MRARGPRSGSTSWCGSRDERGCERVTGDAGRGCAVSGLVGWLDERRDLREHAETFGAMTAALSRRGPDGSGMWISREAALGHRLLAVTHGATAEPAVTVRSGAQLAAVADGAIDNLDEL